MADRTRARALAAQAIRDGAPLRWFDELYQEAEENRALVPWDDQRPNPHLVAWLDANPFPPGSAALDVGCGRGDNAEELARRGFLVTAFDVSPRAVEQAQRRFPQSSVRYQAADLLAPPEEWRGAFALVQETYTLQVLPPVERRRAADALASLVAPGGTLLVIARGRTPDEPAGEMPWPLTEEEVSALAPSLRLVSLVSLWDDETPPVRRFVAVFQRET